MKKLIKIIGIITIIVGLYLFNGIQVSAAELETVIDMDTVIDFTATEYGLQLYFNDGTGYYWEKGFDVGSTQDTYIGYDNNYTQTSHTNWCGKFEL